jgi:hypothetical protein
MANFRLQSNTMQREREIGDKQDAGLKRPEKEGLN